MKYIKEEKEIPTEMQIAKICGTTQATVSRHISETNIEELVRPFKLFGNDVLMGLMNRASKGDAQAAKLFFALVYDWNEKIEHDVEGTIETIIKVHYEDEDEYEDKNE